VTFISIIENNTKNSFTECNNGKTKKLSCGLNSKIGLKKSNYIRQYPHNSQSKHTPLDAITYFTPIVMLTPNGQFLDCASLALGGCHTGQCMRCDGDTIRLRYDYIIFFSNGGLTHWRRHDNDTITTGRCDTIVTPHAFSSPLSRQQNHHNTSHKRRQHQGIGSAVLGHVDLSEETNTGLVVLVAEQSTLFA